LETEPLDKKTSSAVIFRSARTVLAGNVLKLAAFTVGLYS